MGSTRRCHCLSRVYQEPKITNDKAPRSQGDKVRSNGNTGSTGTREYNLALGERRAQGVARLMSAAGAGNNPTQAVSYGEERPVALEHNDSAWSQNRRVEILY